MPEPVRERICEWLRANDIDPATMPEDNAIRIALGTIEYEEVRKDERGHYIRTAFGGDAPLRRFPIGKPLKVATPPLPWPMEA